ncbi:hypothetical protein HGB24_03390, partial [Candidatus Saccharibacteria bacterium]|nr:hypothetical protein [Candidatus Saccharibacteria bacterium]
IPINPYYKFHDVDYTQAIKEHDEVLKILESIGIKIIQVPSPAVCQDGVYTANWALVHGDKAVMSKLPSARQGEQAYAEKILTELGKTVIHLPNNLKFSGQGDALICGSLLFSGSGYRSDADAQEFAARELGLERVQLMTVPLLDISGQPQINSSTGWYDSYFYDLDLALAIIKAPTDNSKGLIAYCPEAFTPASQQILANLSSVDKITVDINEARNGFATNLVSNGTTVVMSDNAPILKNDLEKLGLKVITPKIREIAKGGGFIRCMTLTIE